ncbi:hypothetical protein CEXT_382641 [Caerostris extrusa]|uniref:Uncharacterized protein n=1 Tax=Caerostris extrusa TaxID=172846 RepID=A0AAV4Q2U1_CAEEX|nr:hypothetical protein CEXT_382641 [Caerostris extrusa]
MIQLNCLHFWYSRTQLLILPRSRSTSTLSVDSSVPSGSSLSVLFCLGESTAPCYEMSVASSVNGSGNGTIRKINTANWLRFSGWEILVIFRSCTFNLLNKAATFYMYCILKLESEGGIVGFFFFLHFSKSW